MRVAAERAEEARALLIELFPEGFEEVALDGGIEFAAYTKAGGEERLWQVFGPGAATDVEAGWGEAWKRFQQKRQEGNLHALREEKIKIPDDYLAYLELGRFRNAIVLDDLAGRPTEGMKKFVDAYDLHEARVRER